MLLNVPSDPGPGNEQCQDPAETSRFSPAGCPIHRRKPQAASSNSPHSDPLWRHPRWTYFLSDLNLLILKHAPSFRPHFLELLSRIDSV
jgi:hypothetical protein